MSMQLPQVLIRNSFNILGLSSSAALKEIRKRSQQLLQLAKIEEIQEFDADIGHVREFRSEGEVKLALERISGVKERLREIFFWFDDHNIENQKSIALISQGSYQEAIDILDKTKTTSIDWLEYKNLALALMFQAFASSDLNSFCRSLELWKQLAESEDFWKFYEKHYLLHDELGTSSSLFEEFRGSIYESLSAKALSFFHQTKNPEAIGLYYSAFGQIGKFIDAEVLQPIILKIKKELEDLVELGNDLKACALGELVNRPPMKYDTKVYPPPPGMTGTVVCKETQEDLIKQGLKKIHRYFLYLDKFELSEYSPLAVLRNNSAEKLRSISVDIYNNNCSPEIALLLLELGSKLAMSDAIAMKIEADQTTIKETQLWKTVADRFEKVKELIAKRKIEEAKSGFLVLDNELAQNNDKSINGARVHLFVNYCATLIEKSREFFDKKMFGIQVFAIDGFLNWRYRRDAILAINQALEILKERVCLLSFINHSQDLTSLLKKVDTIIYDSLRITELGPLMEYHQSQLEEIDDIANNQENGNTKWAIQLCGIAACYSTFFPRIREVLQWKIFKLIGWGVAIALIILVNYNKSESKSSYKNNSSYSTTYSPSLTHEEKNVIEYLQKNKPDVLKDVRKQGFSDKQIARYVIDHADDEDE